MPKNKSYSTCTRIVVQGQLDYQTECAGRCCLHGYLGRDVDEKSTLTNKLKMLSGHYKTNGQFLVPSTGESFLPTKNRLKIWAMLIRRTDHSLYDVLACNLCTECGVKRASFTDNFFEELAHYVDCPICSELAKKNLPEDANPKLLLRSFYNKSSGPTNTEGEKLDEKIDQMVAMNSSALCLYKELVEEKKEDPHACIKYVKRTRRKEAKEKLKSFLLTALYGRPDTRMECDPSVFGLCESSGSSSGSSSLGIPGDYSLVQTKRKSRSQKKRVSTSDEVIGLKASSSRDTLFLGPVSKVSKVIREKERTKLIIVFTNWKSRYKRITRTLEACIDADNPMASDVEKREMLVEMRKNHRTCDKAFELSGIGRNMLLRLDSDVDSDTRSEAPP